MDQVLAVLPTVLACTLALALGGVVKGVISLGLPLVGMPLLLFAVDVPTAVNILMIPLILSNFVQVFEGGNTMAVLRRFWPLLICLSIGVIIGTGLVAALDQKLLLLILGSLVILFGIASLVQRDLAIPASAEPWLAPPVGLIAGTIGGMSTLFGPVLALFIVGLHLEREMFVKTISLLYTTGAFFLMVGGTAHGTTDLTQIGISALGMIPVYGGMMIGRRIRHRLDPQRFRTWVLIIVVVTGASLLRAGLKL
jgi:uncharacterized membrane protein YfcA